MPLDEAIVSAVTGRPARELVPTRGFAAVAAVVTDRHDVLLIRRASFPGDPWSGHLAFPGGRMEPTDPAPLDAAIRETREELGLPLSPELLVGALDDLAAVGGRPGLVIRPYVFRWPGALPSLAPNAEVDGVLWLGLERLLANDGRTTMTWERDGVSLRLPCVDFDGHRLWGLTLRMIDDLLDRLDGGGVGTARLQGRGGP